MSFEEEVRYFTANYRRKGDLKELIGFNAKLAEKNQKINVSLIWKNLLKIFYPIRLFSYFYLFKYNNFF